MNELATSTKMYAGAYWPARAESVDACAARADGFLQGLSRIDPLLANWYKRGNSSRSPAPLDTTPAGLIDLLSAGRNRRDADGSVIDQLGYRAGAWNGEPDEDDMAGLSIRCGSSHDNPRIPDAAIVDLPKPSQRSAALYSEPTASALLKLLVETWEPDWATMTSDELREAQDTPRGTPVLGWFTYLSANRGHVPPLDGPFTVEPFARGAIVAVKGGPPDDAVLRDLAAQLGPDLLRPAY